MTSNHQPAVPPSRKDRKDRLDSIIDANEFLPYFKRWYGRQIKERSGRIGHSLAFSWWSDIRIGFPTKMMYQIEDDLQLQGFGPNTGGQLLVHRAVARLWEDQCLT